METTKIKDLIINLRHIGIIVDEAEKKTDVLRDFLGLDEDEVTVMPTSVTGGGSVYSFIPVGGTELELIEPVTEEFNNILGNPPKGINHIAFTVKDLKAAVEIMEKKGVRLGHVTKDGILDTGRSIVAYFNPEDTGGILMEFVEPKGD
ncbi:VOC family protein [Spirochaetota bacterium]